MTKRDVILIVLIVSVWVAQIYSSAFFVFRVSEIESRIRALELAQQASAGRSTLSTLPEDNASPQAEINITVDQQMLMSGVREYQQQTLKTGSGKPINVVIFEDYQCSFCRRLHSDTLALLNESSLSEISAPVIFTYRHFNIFGPKSDRLARLSECAGSLRGQSAFIAARDLIYANVSDTPENLTTMVANAIGIDAEILRSCLDSSAITSALEKDTEVAEKARVAGTPAIFVNGRLIGGYIDLNTFIERLKEGATQ